MLNDYNTSGAFAPPLFLDENSQNIEYFNTKYEVAPILAMDFNCLIIEIIINGRLKPTNRKPG